MRTSLRISRFDLHYGEKKRTLDRLVALGYISQIKLAIRPVVPLRRQEKK